METSLLTKEKKAEIVKAFGSSTNNSGLTEVQVAILTHRIGHLTDHVKKFKKDHAGRLGLLKLVGQRRRLLNYLRNNSEQRYASLIGKLGLRK